MINDIYAILGIINAILISLVILFKKYEMMKFNKLKRKTEELNEKVSHSNHSEKSTSTDNITEIGTEPYNI